MSCNLGKEIDSSYLLRKVVALMECEITRDDISRHFELINSYLQKSQNGFVSFDF